jgi:hypothetical protein
MAKREFEREFERERMDRQKKEKNDVSCCKWVLGLGVSEQEHYQQQQQHCFRSYLGEELSDRASSKKKSLVDSIALVPGLMDGKSIPKPSSLLILSSSFSPPMDTTEEADGWINTMDLGVAKKSMRSWDNTSTWA